MNRHDAIEYLRKRLPFMLGLLHEAVHALLFDYDKWQIRGQSFVCSKCMGHNRDHYMLEDRVWAEANQGDSAGMLHLRCVEENLGRKLRRSDFKDIPLNTQARYFAND